MLASNVLYTFAWIILVLIIQASSLGVIA